MGKPAEIKTKPTSVTIESFLAALSNEQQRKDCVVIMRLMEKATNEKPCIWGSTMIGFGNVRYKSPSGREVDWFKIGFSPRKSNLSLNLIDLRKVADLLPGLGKHKTGTGCLYINKLEDIDLSVLEKIIVAAAK